MVDLKQNNSSLSAVVENLSHSMIQRNNHINRQNGVPGGRNQFRDGNPSNFYDRQYQQIIQIDLAIIKLLINSAKIFNGTV